MNRSFRSAMLLVALGSLTVLPPAWAQSLDTPLTRMRPIGSPSAVDRYRAPAETGRFYQTAYQNGAQVRTAEFVDDSGNQATIRQLQFTAPPIPETFGGPSADSPFADAPPAPAINYPATPRNTPLPSTSLPPFPSTSAPTGSLPATSYPAGEPRSLPMGSGGLSPVPFDSSATSSSDLAPLAQPQLNDGFATIDNCPCVSPPSAYLAASPWPQCMPVAYQAPVGYQPGVNYQTPPPYAAPATTVVEEPIVLPPSLPSRRSGIPRGPLISFGQDRNPVQIGQGIVGQPVAYVPGQRIRNWIRYIFP